MPGSPAMADLLGWAYFKEGATDAAIGQLKESAERAPHNPKFQYHLGVAHQASGRLELVGDSFRRALTGDPAFPEHARCQDCAR